MGSVVGSDVIFGVGEGVGVDVGVGVGVGAKVGSAVGAAVSRTRSSPDDCAQATRQQKQSRMRIHFFIRRHLYDELVGPIVYATGEHAGPDDSGMVQAL